MLLTGNLYLSIHVVCILYFKQTAHLATIGGNNLKDNVRRVLTRLMTHHVSKRYNWSGMNGWKARDENEDKMSFGKLELSNVTTSMCYSVFFCKHNINSTT